MEKREAKELLRKYDAGTCTEEEKALLESWYLEWQGGDFDLNDEELNFIKDRTYSQIVSSRRKEHRSFYWRKYAAAAAVFAILSAGVLIYKNTRPEPNIQERTTQSANSDAAPGGNKALLTLADGTVVELAEAGTGKIAEVAGMRIRKTADGQLVYEATSKPGDEASQAAGTGYNTISTPRGGQYKIILPDGTKVWLNAASSLKYPLRFSNQARNVRLTGEGYFEVKGRHLPNGDRIPFLVNTATQTVEVIGTHFNINSYPDEEAVLTTLLEGAVKVSFNSSGKTSLLALKKPVLLKPGQQAALAGNGFSIKETDVEEVVTWKNGYFSFEKADLKTVMRQLSRWYDVDVVYAGALPTETFTGKVYRNISLSKVLDILSYTQVNFKMEGKKLIITP